MNPFPRLALAALVQTSLLAQATPAEPAKPAKAAKTEQTEPVRPAPGLRSRIFYLKNRRADHLQNILSPLLSGAPGSKLDGNTFVDGLNTLGVRDFPENIAAIEEALTRLDVPQSPSPSPNLLLTFSLLFASKQAQAGQEVDAALKPVIATLQRTLNYTSFVPAGSFQIHTTSEAHGNGVLEDPTSRSSSLPMTWYMKFFQIEKAKDGPASISMGLNFDVRLPDNEEKTGTHSTVRAQNAVLATSVHVKDGETIVVGTSSFKNRALILVLTAKILD